MIYKTRDSGARETVGGAGRLAVLGSHQLRWAVSGAGRCPVNGAGRAAGMIWASGLALAGQVRFRPACLARYKAASAAASRAVRSQAPSRLSAATPIETVTWTRTPARSSSLT